MCVSAASWTQVWATHLYTSWSCNQHISWKTKCVVKGFLNTFEKKNVCFCFVVLFLNNVKSYPLLNMSEFAKYPRSKVEKCYFLKKKKKYFKRITFFKNLVFVSSWALSERSIQKAGVFYIKFFACNFRLHSKVCISIEFLLLLPRNVTKSHQHTCEICKEWFNIQWSAHWHLLYITLWHFFAV